MYTPPPTCSQTLEPAYVGEKAAKALTTMNCNINIQYTVVCLTLELVAIVTTCSLYLDFGFLYFPKRLLPCGKEPQLAGLECEQRPCSTAALVGRVLPVLSGGTKARPVRK